MQNFYLKKIKRVIVVQLVLVMIVGFLVWNRQQEAPIDVMTRAQVSEEVIKWVDFNVSYEALCAAYDWDVETYGTDHEVHWIELLAYTAAKTGGTFDKDALQTLNKAAKIISRGEKTIQELTEGMKYYSYYKEAYTAVLGGMVGEF